MLTAFRMGLLVLSLGGSISLLMVKWRLPAEYAPAVVCAAVSSTMMAAGFLNVMRLAAAIIFIAGLACAAVYGKRALLQSRRGQIVLLIWLGLLVWFAFVLNDARLTHFDNFSHWAVAVKDMLLHDRMPNFQDTDVLMFQAYPLGSSVFIYYVSTLVGQQEWHWMFAQVILCVSFLLPMLAAVKKPAASLLGMPVLWACILVFNVSIYDLLVDTVMPLAGAAAFCVLALDDGSDPVRPLWTTFPLYLFLINVKNSGIFFVVVCWAYYLIKNRRHVLGGVHRLRPFFLWSVLPPLAALYLWKCHTALVFAAGDTVKHAMTLKNFSAVISHKKRLKSCGRSPRNCSPEPFVYTRPPSS